MSKAKRGRGVKIKCRRCGRRLKTLRSQAKRLCIICSPPDKYGIPGSTSQFER